MQKNIFLIFCLLLSAKSYSYIPNIPKSSKELLDSSNVHKGLKKISWISGSWKGEAFGGSFEEIWSEPSGNSMMGMFKLIKDDAIVFYEIMTISFDEEKGLSFQLKHFNADLTGWEEKKEVLVFPLVKITKTEVRFDGIRFKKISDTTMHVFVLNSEKDAAEKEIKFVFKK